MKVVKQGFEFLSPKFHLESVSKEEIGTYPASGIEILRHIERCGRVCYKSEDKIAGLQESADRIRSWIKKGHHSVIEHASIGVLITTDRGVTHEIVRHRLASYSQESTRYCNYSQDKFGNEITVILPVWFDGEPEKEFMKQKNEYLLWLESCRISGEYYFKLLDRGQSPQQARSVLPNSLKTEIAMTCNIREWIHFFNLRCSPAAHPQMRHLALGMLVEFHMYVPVFFDDVYLKYFR